MSELIAISQDVETVAQTANVIIRKLEQENEKLRLQLEKAKFALEECCHMAGAHTESDAEDWLDSIREYSLKQLTALTDDFRGYGDPAEMWEAPDDLIHASDCAVNNAPALPVGPCNCGTDLAASGSPQKRSTVRLVSEQETPGTDLSSAIRKDEQ